MTRRPVRITVSVFRQNLGTHRQNVATTDGRVTRDPHDCGASRAPFINPTGFLALHEHASAPETQA